jgi:4-amino-4-deoxy-L-arabinose transferase-like glycosyltransferase
VVGRFLKVLFVLPGSRLHNVDLNKNLWHFYLTTLPTIVGGAIIILPLTIWDAMQQTVASLRHRAQNRDVHADTKLLLLIWAIVPVFLLSFSAAKQTSYILPSYAAMAILVGAWLDKRLSKKQDGGWDGIGWLSVAAAVAIASIFSSRLGVKTYLIIPCGFTALTIPVLLILFYKKKFTQFCFLFIALSIGPLLIFYTPNVQAEFRNGRCSLRLAHEVWARVGDAPLYLYQPRDTIRGSIPFYGNRTIRELDFLDELNAVLLSSQKVFVLMSDKALVNIQKNKSFLNRYTVKPLPNFGCNQQFILLVNLRN